MRLRLLSLDGCWKYATNPGDRFKKEYKPKMATNGTFRLVEVGTVDLHQKILAEVPLTDMNVILKNLERGDTSGLNPNVPLFGDFTQLPTTMAEALQMVMDGQRTFDSLPLETREHYGQDFRRWFADAGSPKWLEVMGYNPSVPASSGSGNSQNDPTIPAVSSDSGGVKE